MEECGPCPVFASFTLALTLQMRKKTSVRVKKTSVGVRKTSVRVQYTYYQSTVYILPKLQYTNTEMCTLAVVPYTVQLARAVIMYIYGRIVTSYQVQLATASTLYIRSVIPYQVQLYTASILYIISLKLGYVIALLCQPHLFAGFSSNLPRNCRIAFPACHPAACYAFGLFQRNARAYPLCSRPSFFSFEKCTAQFHQKDILLQGDYKLMSHSLTILSI